MSKLSTMDWIAMILLIVGGLNWGFVAFGWNIVGALLGGIPMLLTAVYFLVGLSAIYMIFMMKKLMAPASSM